MVNASLVSATDGRTLTQTSVTGPHDSLFVLIDRLTAQLLALGTGASADQLSALTTTTSTRCAPTSMASPPSAAASSRTPRRPSPAR